MPSSEPPPVGQRALAPTLPGEPPLELLGDFERGAFRFIDRLIRHHIPHTELYNKSLGLGYILAGSGRMVKVRGLDRLRHLTPDDGIILVSNHRSFFDLYMLMAALYRYTPLQQPLVCPVRGNFFYEQPLGIVVNFLASGGRMYPPFFREPARAKFNLWSLLRTAELVRQGKVLVGFHPEGTRNKNPNPYNPLPAQPGIGKLVFESRKDGKWPIVVPAFIHGMSQDILADIKANFTGERYAIAVFGEPIDLSRFDAMGNRLSTHKRIADHLLSVIYGLSVEERAARAEHERTGWR